MNNRGKPNRAWGEALGILLLGVGLLLFLSLLSYDTNDIPSWAPLISASSSPNDPVNNLVGTFGALTGGYSYFFFGVASYLLAALVFGLGLGKLFVP